METRDKELFLILTNSLMKGSGMHSINTMNDESGHQAIQDIKTWNGYTATSRPIIDHYRSCLEQLQLTEETTASSYVNEFLICSSNIEKKRECYTAATKRHKHPRPNQGQRLRRRKTATPRTYIHQLRQLRQDDHIPLTRSIHGR